MSNLLNISEAASLALHAMVYLAQDPDGPVPTGEIASAIRASEAHLSKVFQRLAKAGLARAIRGPKGGFMLGKSSKKIRLLDIYEAIEGPLAPTACLLERPICGGRCILGALLETLNKNVVKHLSGTRLSMLTSVYRSKDAHA